MLVALDVNDALTGQLLPAVKHWVPLTVVVARVAVVGVTADIPALSVAPVPLVIVGLLVWVEAVTSLQPLVPVASVFIIKASFCPWP
jgi:hypothetical protein